MKKLNLQLGSIKEMLTKEQMKKVSGGYDDCDSFSGCGNDHSTSHLYCCGLGGDPVDLGDTTCNCAAAACVGGKVTNSPSTQCT